MICRSCCKDLKSFLASVSKQSYCTKGSSYDCLSDACTPSPSTGCEGLRPTQGLGMQPILSVLLPQLQVLPKVGSSNGGQDVQISYSCPAVTNAAELIAVSQ